MGSVAAVSVFIRLLCMGVAHEMLKMTFSFLLLLLWSCISVGGKIKQG